MTTVSISMEKDRPTINEKKVLLTWSLTVWLVVMNTTMFNVALPTVLEEFSLTSSTVSWIVSGYSIVFAISTLTYSRLSDFIPIRRLLMIGLVILGIASVIGLLAHQFYLLLLARLLQAAGAGAVPGLAMVLAGRYIPVERRGRAMSYIASAASLGFGLGPVIGGGITEYLGWNYLFIVTGFVLLMLPLFARLLPNEDISKIRFDFLGAILTALSVTGLLLYVTTFSIYFLGVSLIAFFLLWKRIHAIPIPFIQPALLKNGQFCRLLFIGLTGFLTHFSVLFLMPIMLSTLFQKDAAAIGFIIFPGAILSAVAAQFIGRQIDKHGNIPMLFTGLVLLVFSSLIFGSFADHSPYIILFTYMFTSVGFSSLVSSIGNEVSRILPNKEIGAGMGIVQLTQFFGGAFGVALTGLLLVVQGEYTPEISYRNIFYGVTLLLAISLVTLRNYSKRLF